MTTRPEKTPVRVGDRYRIEERIGAGAMGAVWRATDELLNRTVAVKEILAVPPGGGETALEESRERILREGRIGARLQHAHVISMFDVVVHEDRPWLVMEYLPSKSLAAVLHEKGPMPPRDAAEMGRQVADGLAAAHLAGVVHRDVKPGNVLLGEDGRIKITDFGISRAVDDVQLTRTGLIAGTPAFLSPEVARGQEPTAASDVFALGATLYAAVEGRPPFGLDDNAYALLHKVATGVVEPPQQAGPLGGVIMRLLSKEPADRPSAAQARDALAEVAQGRAAEFAGPATAVLGAAAVPAAAAAAAPAASGPPTRTDLPRPPAPAPVPRPASAPRPASGRRPRPPLMLLAVLALLLVAGGLAAALLSDGSPGTTAPPQAAPPAATAAPQTPEPTTSAAPSTTSATPSPTPAPLPPPPTSSAPPPTQAPAPAPSAGDPIGFVQSYYGLLPGNTDAAWARLGPSAREASGGRESYDRFYGSLQDVSLRDARQTGEDTVQGTVVFVQRDGRTSSEAYRFVVGTGEDGTMILESFSRA